jgi:hypothetical protein
MYYIYPEICLFAEYLKSVKIKICVTESDKETWRL